MPCCNFLFVCVGDALRILQIPGEHRFWCLPKTLLPVLHRALLPPRWPAILGPLSQRSAQDSVEQSQCTSQQQAVVPAEAEQAVEDAQDAFW